ncbi:MAG: hypothetical protein R3E58_08705 [Phycisphaerae bacterium]
MKRRIAAVTQRTKFEAQAKIIADHDFAGELDSYNGNHAWRNSTAVLEKLGSQGSMKNESKSSTQ